jgi:hypothetical protein
MRNKFVFLVTTESQKGKLNKAGYGYDDDAATTMHGWMEGWREGNAMIRRE